MVFNFDVRAIWRSGLMAPNPIILRYHFGNFVHLQGYLSSWHESSLRVDGADETGQMVLMTERDTHSRKILGLLKFTNYSVQVLARTQVGDGVASAPIYVQTRNDCTSLSVLLSSSSSLLAICRPSSCTVLSGVVVVGVCNRSQMRTSKCTCTCLIFGRHTDGDD